MDLTPYRSAPRRAVMVAGQRFVLRALTRAQRREAESEARALFGNHGCPAEGPWFELARRGALVAASAGWPASVLRSHCTAAAIGELAEICDELEAEAMPDAGRLKESLRKGVCRDAELVMDGLAAYLAAGASDYYGRPAAELTDGQLLYWALLRAAFEEFHMTDKVKNVSKAWLESED